VQEVLFDGDRAVGVRAKVADGWEKDIFARFVVDASGRRCVLASQLGLKRMDPNFNQFAIYSWFKDLAAPRPETEGMLFLHFLGLERGWAWQIPLRNGLWSVGVVVDKSDFKKYGSESGDFFYSLMARNRNLAHNMRDAVRVRQWWMEGDYSYKIDKLVGPGWLLVGDALRFVDPIFSTGVDVAAYSAQYAFESITAVLEGADEKQVFAAYEHRISDGVEAWYDLIALFYKLQNLFTIFAVDKRHHESVVRILQGNPYMPESLARAREVIATMEEAYERILRQPTSLLSHGAFSRYLKGKESTEALSTANA
jgi:FADH2 O2-dependent halogenase